MLLPTTRADDLALTSMDSNVASAPILPVSRLAAQVCYKSCLVNIVQIASMAESLLNYQTFKQIQTPVVI